VSDESTDQPKRKKLSEIAVMSRIEKLIEELTPDEQRRVAFVFADRVGLAVCLPNSRGEGD
jgi:hypothetical protein